MDGDAKIIGRLHAARRGPGATEWRQKRVGVRRRRRKSTANCMSSGCAREVVTIIDGGDGRLRSSTVGGVQLVPAPWECGVWRGEIERQDLPEKNGILLRMGLTCCDGAREDDDEGCPGWNCSRTMEVESGKGRLVNQRPRESLCEPKRRYGNFFFCLWYLTRAQSIPSSGNFFFSFPFPAQFQPQPIDLGSMRLWARVGVGKFGGGDSGDPLPNNRPRLAKFSVSLHGTCVSALSFPVSSRPSAGETAHSAALNDLTSCCLRSLEALRRSRRPNGQCWAPAPTRQLAGWRPRRAWVPTLLGVSTTGLEDCV
jgi:hypothetical protein